MTTEEIFLSDLVFIQIKKKYSDNKVRNKERTEQMHSRNTGTGQNSNLEHPEEKPIR